MLGTFLNDPLGVLAKVAGYVAGIGLRKMLLASLEVDREPGTV